MLQPSTLQFLTDLRANNSKPWFDANRKTYEAARADLIKLADVILQELKTIDPAIAQSNLQAKNGIFRINRDVRFSHDKSPYKTNFGIWFNAGGKKAPTAGYYVNVEPGHGFAAGGLYMPEAAALASIRQEIDYHLPEFEGLLQRPGFQQYFGQLSQESALVRPPKGYEADNPALPYLKLKSFTASHPLPDYTFLGPHFRQQIAAAFTELQPLVAFLNRAIG